jgi:hypothetical protein
MQKLMQGPPGKSTTKLRFWRRGFGAYILLALAFVPWHINFGDALTVSWNVDDWLSVSWVAPRPLVYGPAAPTSMGTDHWIADGQDFNRWTVQHERQYFHRAIGFEIERGAFVHVENGRYAADGVYHEFRVPSLAIVALFAGPLIWWTVVGLRFVRVEKRSREGRCASCGYDLRASPGRCPECGAVRAADSSH